MFVKNKYMQVEAQEKYPSQSFLSTSSGHQVTGMTLPYFQSSSPQYQAQCLQSPTDMVNTARNQCENNNFASTYKRYTTTTVLNCTTCSWRYTLLNGAISIVELTLYQIRWNNDLQQICRDWKEPAVANYKEHILECLETLTKSKKIVVKIRDTLRFNLLSLWMQVLVPCTAI